MKRVATLKNLIIAFMLTVIILLPSAGAGGYARAAADSVSERYEAQNVWTDLQGAKFSEEGLDLSIYNFDERKQPQIISFVELCYSFYSDMQGDYGLYVYVYNPKGEDFTKNEALNKIQLRYGESSSAPFKKYSLKYLNRSEEPGFEGLFYKFKVALTESERAEILSGINSTERVYEVSGIELYSAGTNATEYKVSNKYTYTGYAEGYGSKTATTDTLTCRSSGMDVTLSLDVHPTCYMPEGTEGTNNYTSDCLHSVYFSIPNKILEQYGGLAAVHATWLNAKTSPIYVTGNKDMYNAFKRVAEADTYKGDLSDYLADGNELNYAFLVNAVKSLVIEPGNYYTADMSFNMDGVANSVIENYAGYGYWKESDDIVINDLPYVIYAENGNVDTYTLPGENLLEYMREYSENVAYLDPVAGKYYRGLFESIDEAYTDKNIEAEDSYTLTTQNTSQYWWEWLLGMSGTQVEYGKTFDNIKAIQPVTDNDFKDKSAEEICRSLYISQSDYASFTAHYTAAKAAQKTTFLFRYYQSKYESREVTHFERRYYSPRYSLRLIDTNAFLAQAVVNLDFDIIDVTCRKGDVNTVIACVMSPMDISPDIRHPVHTTPDGTPWWFYVLLIVFVILFIVVLCVLFPPVWKVIKTILGVLAAPFKVLGRHISERNAERRQRKEMLRQEKLTRKERMKIAQYQDKLNRKEQKRREKLNAKEEARTRKRKAKANKKKRKSRKKKGKKK